jgi:transposase
MAVMIGIDPHKASHTAAAIDKTEKVLGELTVRSGANQVERLVGWASQFEERTWAVEGAGGLGYLLAQQLVAAGEHVVDVQPKLAARVQLLSNAATNKNDPNDARSVAIVALRSPSPVAVHAEDHTAVMKVWSKRHSDLASHRTRVAWSPTCGAARARPWWLLRSDLRISNSKTAGRARAARSRRHCTP